MTFVFNCFCDILSLSMFVVLQIIYSTVFICILSFHNHGRCHTCMFLVKHPIYNDVMTGLLIGMRAYVNCVCRLLRFFGENSKVLLFLLLLE